jgi:hypothetical protein
VAFSKVAAPVPVQQVIPVSLLLWVNDKNSAVQCTVIIDIPDRPNPGNWKTWYDKLNSTGKMYDKNRTRT